jgi:hypothetical protein
MEGAEYAHSRARRNRRRRGEKTPARHPVGACSSARHPAAGFGENRVIYPKLTMLS